jgi:transposase
MKSKVNKSLLLLSAIIVTTNTQAQTFTPQQICRATIAAVMGRSPSIIKLESISGDQINVAYTRSDDGSRWRNRCRIQGQTIVWATAEGRWRNSPEDEVITYSTSTSTLTIIQKYPDGSKTAKNYTAAQLAN